MALRISLSSIALFVSLALPVPAQEAQSLTPSGDPAPIPAVRLIAPEEGDASRKRAFFGRVAARETVDLAFEVGGRLIDLRAQEGAQIPEGEVIAQLDADPFARAVERAELALSQAERDAGRAAQLAAANVAADVQAEDTATARDLADVELRDARDALTDATLRAPFDGIVAERIAPLFTFVEPGQAILRLHDMSEVRVEIDMPEQVLQRAGSITAITFEGVLADGRTVPLSLAEFEAETGRVGQSFLISLAVPNTASDGLIPGASMTVNAILPAGDAGLLVPPAAVLANTKRGFEVMVYEPVSEVEGTVARREVEVRAPTGVGFEISGLAPGERIVAVGAHLLSDGQRVRPYEGLTAEEP